MSGAFSALGLVVGLLSGGAHAGARSPGPEGGGGDRGGDALPTLVLAFGGLGWAGLAWSLARAGRAPAAVAGGAGGWRPGLHPVEGPPEVALAALIPGHRVLLVGPVPSSLDLSKIPSGSIFPMGDSAVPTGRLLRAKRQLEGRGPPLVVLLLVDPVEITGEASLSLEALALRRLRLPILRLHMPLQFSGDASPALTHAATMAL